MFYMNGILFDSPNMPFCNTMKTTTTKVVVFIVLQELYNQTSMLSQLFLTPFFSANLPYFT